MLLIEGVSPHFSRPRGIAAGDRAAGGVTDATRPMHGKSTEAGRLRWPLVGDGKQFCTGRNGGGAGWNRGGTNHPRRTL